jgi:Transposase IS200 like
VRICVNSWRRIAFCARKENKKDNPAAQSVLMKSSANVSRLCGFFLYLKKIVMKEGYVVRDQTLPHFITATVVDLVDVFTRKTYRDAVIDCFDYCIKNKGMILYSYVIMSNHIHMIVQSNEGKLSDLLRDFKKFTSKIILDKIHSEPE